MEQRITDLLPALLQADGTRNINDTILVNQTKELRFDLSNSYAPGSYAAIGTGNDYFDITYAIANGNGGHDFYTVVNVQKDAIASYSDYADYKPRADGDGGILIRKDYLVDYVNDAIANNQNNSDVVTKSGDEEITGIKSFINEIGLQFFVADPAKAIALGSVQDDELIINSLSTGNRIMSLHSNSQNQLHDSWEIAQNPIINANFTDSNDFAVIRKDYLVNYVKDRFLPATGKTNGDYEIENAIVKSGEGLKFDTSAYNGAGAYNALTTFDESFRIRIFYNNGTQVVEDYGIGVEPYGFYGDMPYALYRAYAVNMNKVAGGMFTRNDFLEDFVRNIAPVTPPGVKNAVKGAAASTWNSGELQGPQPLNSKPGMKFCDANYCYEYMNGMNDTDGTSFVWVRTIKG